MKKMNLLQVSCEYFLFQDAFGLNPAKFAYMSENLLGMKNMYFLDNKVLHVRVHLFTN